MVRLTDGPDMTLDVYRGRKTTMQCNNTHKTLALSLSFSQIMTLFDGGTIFLSDKKSLAPTIQGEVIIVNQNYE